MGGLRRAGGGHRPAFARDTQRRRRTDVVAGRDPHRVHRARHLRRRVAGRWGRAALPADAAPLRRPGLAAVRRLFYLAVGRLATTRWWTTAYHRRWYRVAPALASRGAWGPVVLITTVGRRTGEPRSAPVFGWPEGEAVVVVASNAGHDRAPAWYLNLRAKNGSGCGRSSSAGTRGTRCTGRRPRGRSRSCSSSVRL
ncbi:MAG: nitroreductase family deazaflavin-dependent oxidoreductase [Chloroflexi bacterium]|nr:MAG: nitroreductase family deazaflavin-dependent oxidoreductase [Chloroflexota bacterium]